MVIKTWVVTFHLLHTHAVCNYTAGIGPVLFTYTPETVDVDGANGRYL